MKLSLVFTGFLIPGIQDDPDKIDQPNKNKTCYGKHDTMDQPIFFHCNGAKQNTENNTESNGYQYP